MMEKKEKDGGGGGEGADGVFFFVFSEKVGSEK